MHSRNTDSVYRFRAEIPIRPGIGPLSCVIELRLSPCIQQGVEELFHVVLPKVGHFRRALLQQWDTADADAFCMWKMMQELAEWCNICSSSNTGS